MERWINETAYFKKDALTNFFNQLIYRYLGGNAKVRKGEGVSSIY